MGVSTLVKATNYYAMVKPDSETVSSLLVTPFQLGVLRCGGTFLLLIMEYRTSHMWVRYLLGMYTAACFSLGVAALCVAKRAPIDRNLKFFLETLYCVSVALMIAGCYYSMDCLNAVWFIISHALLLPKIRFRPKMFLPILFVHFPLIYLHMYSIVKAKYLAFPSIGSIGDIFHIFLVIYYKSTYFKTITSQDKMNLFLSVAISSGIVYASCHFALKIEGYYYLIVIFKNKVAQKLLNMQLRINGKDVKNVPKVSKAPKASKGPNWFSTIFSRNTAKKNAVPSRIPPPYVQRQQKKPRWFR